MSLKHDTYRGGRPPARSLFSAEPFGSEQPEPAPSVPLCSACGVLPRQDDSEYCTGCEPDRYRLTPESNPIAPAEHEKPEHAQLQAQIPIADEGESGAESVQNEHPASVPVYVPNPHPVTGAPSHVLVQMPTEPPETVPEPAPKPAKPETKRQQKERLKALYDAAYENLNRAMGPALRGRILALMSYQELRSPRPSVRKTVEERHFVLPLPEWEHSDSRVDWTQSRIDGIRTLAGTDSDSILRAWGAVILALDGETYDSQMRARSIIAELLAEELPEEPTPTLDSRQDMGREQRIRELSDQVAARDRTIEGLTKQIEHMRQAKEKRGERNG